MHTSRYKKTLFCLFLKPSKSFSESLSSRQPLTLNQLNVLLQHKNFCNIKTTKSLPLLQTLAKT